MKNKCPKCDYKELKSWNELTEDEKMVVRVKHSDFPLEQRKKHRFCVQCWFDEDDRDLKV